MNSSDGGNLIHITHFSSALPKEDRRRQSRNVCPILYILLINNVIMVVNTKALLKTE